MELLLIYFLLIMMFIYTGVVCFNINKDFIQRVVFNNYPYRLSDVFNGYIKRDDTNYIKYLKYKKPNSIANKYINATEKKLNYDVLLDIMDKDYKYVEKPKFNELVIHIRLGDVMSGINNISEFWYGIDRKNIGNRYVKNKHYYLNTLYKIPLEVDTVVIVSGIHQNYDKTKEKSEEYLKLIENFYKSYGYNTRIRFNGDPDEDFVYISNARNFIKGGGGFSDQLSKIVKKRGNNFIDEDEEETYYR